MFQHSTGITQQRPTTTSRVDVRTLRHVPWGRLQRGLAGGVHNLHTKWPACTPPSMRAHVV